ncbi:hypothetical protein BGW38_008852, partial [Lunasporangiospora selenospora]
AVWFANSAGKIWQVPNEYCNNLPGWINDKAVKYEIEHPYICNFSEHVNCSGATQQVGPTPWKKVPFAGISSVQCFKKA